MKKKINKKANKKKQRQKTKQKQTNTKQRTIGYKYTSKTSSTKHTKQNKKGKKPTQNKIKLIENQESVNNIPNKQQRRRGYLAEQRVVVDYQMLIIQRKTKYRPQKN